MLGPVSFVNERNLTRLCGGCILLAACIVPALMAKPKKAPDYALGSNAALYLERSFLILVLGLVVLTVLVWTVIRGTAPASFTRDGITWAGEVTQETKRADDALQSQIDELAEDVRELANRAVLRP